MKRVNNKDYFQSGYLLLFIGFLLRLIFIYIFKGGGDPWNFETFNEYLIDGQSPFGIPYLPTAYLFGYVCAALVHYFGLFFSFWMRLGDLFADMGIVVLLSKIAKKMNKPDRYSLFICLAYILNPISFNLTVFHGQFDQFVFIFLLLAVYIEMSDFLPGSSKTIASALALVLASYIKPYVFIFFPIFFFKRSSFNEKRIFVLIYAIGCILPFFLLFDPRLIWQAVYAIVSYQSGVNSQLGWGTFTQWFSLSREFVDTYAKFAQPIIVICAIILGYLGRKQNILLSLLIVTLVTYIASPGLASQYLYWAIPLGVIFIDKFFCLYSVLGFIWQLNFPHYLALEKGFYYSYHQFLPPVFIRTLYNSWLYPAQFARFLHFLMGVIIIPALIIIWLISLLKKYNFLFDISKNTFSAFWQSIFGEDKPAAGLSRRSTPQGNSPLFIILIALIAGWLIWFGIVFSKVERYPLWRELKNVLLHKGEKNKTLADLAKSYYLTKSTPRHYPKNIKFEGKKIEQYFMHGRNGELVEELKINNPASYFIRVTTPELYKVYVNGNFVEFNWASDYKKEFGTNRMYKKEFPTIDITKFLRVDLNEIRIVANFSFEKPGRNYIKLEIMDEYRKILFSKRENLPLIPQKPFYLSMPLLLSLFCFLYLIFFLRTDKYATSYGKSI